MLVGFLWSIVGWVGLIFELSGSALKLIIFLRSSRACGRSLILQSEMATWIIPCNVHPILLNHLQRIQNGLCPQELKYCCIPRLKWAVPFVIIAIIVIILCIVVSCSLLWVSVVLSCSWVRVSTFCKWFLLFSASGLPIYFVQTCPFYPFKGPCQYISWKHFSLSGWMKIIYLTCMSSYFWKSYCLIFQVNF